MRLKRTVGCLLAAGMILAAPNGDGWALTAFNQNYNFNFRFNTPGARANAMGGAFIGMADDASAAYSNPAGLTILPKPEVSVEYKSAKYENTFYNNAERRRSRLPGVSQTQDGWVCGILLPIGFPRIFDLGEGLAAAVLRW